MTLFPKSPRRCTYGTIACALALSLALSLSSASAADGFAGGVVYGPKAAFSIKAPRGWVLDNQAGNAQGFPCVFYPKGSSWADSDVVMYAEILSTDITDRDAYIAEDLKTMKERDPKLNVEHIAEGKTTDGCSYVINNYHRHSAENGHVQIERSAYVQLPGAVALIVFMSPSEDLHLKNAGVLTEVLNSFHFLKIGKEKPKKQP